VNRIGPLVLGVVLVAAAQRLPTAPPTTTPEGVKTTLRGRVTDARTGAAVRGAQVVIEVDRNRPAATAHADHDGRFELTDAPVGTHQIAARKPGYERFRRQIEIPAKEVSGLAVRLNRHAVIAGRVTDERGRPVIGAQVVMLVRNARLGALTWRSMGAGREGYGRASTDDQGYYRLWDLPAGSYLMEVRPKAEPGLPGVARLAHSGGFFPGVSSRDDAAKIALAWGQTLEGVDFVTSPSARTTAAGIVTRQGPGSVCESCFGYLIRQGSGAGERLLPAHPNEEGAMVFEGLAPGRYGVSLQSFNRRESSMMHGAAWFDVTEGRTGEFLIELAGEQPVSGRVVLENPPDAKEQSSQGGQGPSQGRNMVIVSTRPDPGNPLAARGSRGGSARIPLQGTGPFDIEMTVLPGSTLFQVHLGSMRGYLKEIRLEGRDLETDRVVVPSGGLENLEIVMAFDGGSVSGTVKNVEDADGPILPARVMVRLIPAGDTAEKFSRRLSGGISAESAFSVLGVPPGRYVAYALPGEPGYSIEDPEVQGKLKAYAKAVEVRAGEATEVTLAVAPRLDALP